jgi:TRAP-type transport system periplasmic protein
MSSTWRRLSMALGVVGFAAVSASHADATSIRYSEYGPDRGVRADAIKWFAEEVENRSNGEITIDLHWGGALVGGREVMRAVESGFIDAGTFVPSWEPELLHLYEVGDLPIGSPDAWVAMRAIYEVATENEAVIDEFAEHDATYLLQFNTGPVQLICREPIETVEDFQGRRIRAVGPYIEAFQALGAEIVSFPQIEVYQALDSGLVDCNQVYWSNVTAYRLHEVADYLVQLDYGQMLGLVGVINKPLWDGLSAEHQALMREVGSETVDFLARKLLELEDEVKANLTGGIDGHTVEIRQVPDDVMQVVLDEGSGLADVWLEAVQGKGLRGKPFWSTSWRRRSATRRNWSKTAIRGSDAATSRQRWTIAPSPATGRTRRASPTGGCMA